MVYTIEGGRFMPRTRVAKLFRNGSSQAVRLPREFRFDGNQVRIRRVPRGVLLEPLIPDATLWFQELDRFKPDVFMPKSRRQTKTPKRDIF
jgi:antitoxin VapB